MTKRTIEIDDTLEETINTVKEEVRQNFLDYLKDNPELDDFEDYCQDTGCDAVHEIADSNTPIYYSEIDGLYYLYGSEFDEAYSNAGIGKGDEDNHRQVAIYCYLSEKAFDYQRELQDNFEEYLASELPDKKIEDFIPEVD